MFAFVDMMLCLYRRGSGTIFCRIKCQHANFMPKIIIAQVLYYVLEGTCPGYRKIWYCYVTFVCKRVYALLNDDFDMLEFWSVVANVFIDTLLDAAHFPTKSSRKR